MKINKRTYTLSIEAHSDGYLASFPELPGCYTWGKTFEDAVKFAEDALIGYIEAIRRNGRASASFDSTAKVSLGVVVEVPANV